MSMFISHAPVLEHTATENTSAFPDAPQWEASTRPARSRHLVAAFLRRTASLELAVAARLERPVRRRLAAA
ncbi:MAG TPA: hypothetical protein VGK18_09065 [Propionicimonas sp.]|jgi:hypothetical protein|uniref:hypothetical protein n=1 Tax=Propionicimonas sp. TaxID=1955623 RepID=UPI002F42D3A3